MDLKGKTVIVTGSSRGIGEAIAEAYAKRGANIVLNARKPIAEEKVAHLESYGVTVKTLLGDVSDFETAKEIVSQTKELFGSVDVLVNNAPKWCKKRIRNSGKSCCFQYYGRDRKSVV